MLLTSTAKVHVEFYVDFRNNPVFVEPSGMGVY